MKHGPRKQMRRNQLLVRTLGFCLCMPAGNALFTLPASAQTTGSTLSGTVTDATGAVIPHATVILRSSGSGDTRSIKSNDQG